MTDVADKLREARKLIQRGWTQDAFARNAAGEDIGDDGEGPVCWCAVGALRDVRGMNTALQFFQAAIGQHSVISWNDAPYRTQADVIAAFDKAIELAEQSA